MTSREIAEQLEKETHTNSWLHAPLEVRLEVIEGLIDLLSAEPEQAAKKVKQRKARKPKQAPLTQHAEGSE